MPPTGEDRQEPRKRGATAGSRVTWVAFGKAQLTAVFSASPSAMASSGDSSTTSRPPPSSGTRITMPRPSLVTSSGPSPVRGFIAAIRHPLSCLGAAGTSRGLRHPLRFPAGPASHNHVDQYLYYPEFRPAVLTISVPADASLSGECQARLGSGGEIGALTDHLRGSSGEGGAAPGPAETRDHRAATLAFLRQEQPTYQGRRVRPPRRRPPRRAVPRAPRRCARPRRRGRSAPAAGSFRPRRARRPFRSGTRRSGRG